MKKKKENNSNILIKQNIRREYLLQNSYAIVYFGLWTPTPLCIGIRCSVGILILKYQDSIGRICFIIFSEDVSIIDLFHYSVAVQLLFKSVKQKIFNDIVYFINHRAVILHYILFKHPYSVNLNNLFNILKFISNVKLKTMRIERYWFQLDRWCLVAIN